MRSSFFLPSCQATPANTRPRLARSKCGWPKRDTLDRRRRCRQLGGQLTRLPLGGRLKETTHILALLRRFQDTTGAVDCGYLSADRSRHLTACAPSSPARGDVAAGTLAPIDLSESDGIWMLCETIADHGAVYANFEASEAARAADGAFAQLVIDVLAVFTRPQPPS